MANSNYYSDEITPVGLLTEDANIVKMLSREEAHQLIEMFSSPAWGTYMGVVGKFKQLYTQIMLSVGYGPHAQEKFRHYQTMAQNIERWPTAIGELAFSAIEEKNGNRVDLDSGDEY